MWGGMSLISFAAALAVSCQFISWYGLFSQIRFTDSRQDTSGLSLVEAESRLWGKLPWLLFACSLPVIDWTVLATNSVSIFLAGCALWQFLAYNFQQTPRIAVRVYLQFALLVLTVFVCVIARDTLTSQKTFWCVLPVIVTVVALSMGSVSQFRENLRRRNTAALSLTRYLTLVASYVLWFSYGFIKGVTVGWDGAWTICLSTGLGLVTSVAILAQFYLYRERRPRVCAAFITLAEHKTAQRA